MNPGIELSSLDIHDCIIGCPLFHLYPPLSQIYLFNWRCRREWICFLNPVSYTDAYLTVLSYFLRRRWFKTPRSNGDNISKGYACGEHFWKHSYHICYLLVILWSEVIQSTLSLVLRMFATLSWFASSFRSHENL